MIKLIVDNREIEAAQGTSLLKACLDNDIYIPNLCHIEERENPSTSCRLCFVEIQGEPRPVTSCSTKVKDGMVVKTDTPEVRRLQRSGLKLLLSAHRVECGKCPANRKCELQRIAKFLKTGLRPKNLDTRLKETEVDDSHPLLRYFPNRCVLCGKCIYVCGKNNSRVHLTFAGRGLDTVISFYGEESSSDLSCKDCLACIEICPVSALTLKE